MHCGVEEWEGKTEEERYKVLHDACLRKESQEVLDGYEDEAF